MRLLALVLMLFANSVLAQPVTVSWEAPVEYTDGTALDPVDIQEYEIFYSETSGGPYLSYAITQNLSYTGTVPGNKHHYFVVIVRMKNGDESGYSNEDVKLRAKPKPPKNHKTN